MQAIELSLHTSDSRALFERRDKVSIQSNGLHASSRFEHKSRITQTEQKCLTSFAKSSKKHAYRVIIKEESFKI